MALGVSQAMLRDFAAVERFWKGAAVERFWKEAAEEDNVKTAQSKAGPICSPIEWVSAVPAAPRVARVGWQAFRQVKIAEVGWRSQVAILTNHQECVFARVRPNGLILGSRGTAVDLSAMLHFHGIHTPASVKHRGCQEQPEDDRE